MIAPGPVNQPSAPDWDLCNMPREAFGHIEGEWIGGEIARTEAVQTRRLARFAWFALGLSWGWGSAALLLLLARGGG